MSVIPVFDADLLRRYDRPGPRYTSYPTAPQFGGDFGEAELRESIRRSNGDPIPRRLSLYVHVPFCFSPCFYCGCNRIITRDATQGRTYVARLVREIEQLGALFDRDREVIQLHFGGGTPNFLRPQRAARSRRRASRSHFRLSRAPIATSRSSSIRASFSDGDVAALRATRLQSRQPRRAGFRSGGAARGEPHPERRGDGARDRRLPRRRLPLGQRRPDLRVAEADAGGIRAHARHGAREPAPTASRSTATRICRICSSRSGRSRRPTCLARRRSSDCCSWRSTSCRRRATRTSAWTTSPCPTTTWRARRRRGDSASQLHGLHDACRQRPGRARA